MDSKKNLAYISSPDDSVIYQVSLTDMSMKKKIKVNITILQGMVINLIHRLIIKMNIYL